MVLELQPTAGFLFWSTTLFGNSYIYLGRLTSPWGGAMFFLGVLRMYDIRSTPRKNTPPRRLTHSRPAGRGAAMLPSGPQNVRP